MALFISTKGTESQIKPEKPPYFTLREMQKFVQGYVEVVTLADGRSMLVNEEGISQGCEFNPKATQLCGGIHRILGDVLICDPGELD